MRLQLVVVGLLFGIAAPCARAQDAQDAKVVRDEWSASFRGKAKVGWGHVRIAERPAATGGGFVVEERSWTPIGEGEVCTVQRTTTDASGRVQRHEADMTAPWGATSVRVEPGEGEALRYRVVVRQLPPVEGTIEEAWNGDVLTLLVHRGAQPPGKRSVRALDLPGDGWKEREVDIRRDPEGWKTVGKSATTWRTREGRFLRSESKEQREWIALPARDEEHAKDRTVRAEDRPDAEAQEACSGMRLTRPGVDWTIMRTEEEGRVMIGTEHPCGAGALVMTMPMRLPAEERDRLRMAAAMREGMNSSSAKSPTGDGPVMGAPELATWQDRPAVRYPLSGRMQMVPMTGEALLVGCEDGTTALVFYAWPEDLAEAQASTVAGARAALTTGKSEALAWKRVTLGDVTLEAPADWVTVPNATQMKSAMGASQLNASTGRLPDGMEMRQAQDLWVAQQRRNQALEAVEVERQEEVTVDGLTAQLTVVRAKLKPINGVAPNMRCLSCAITRDDGTYVEVVVVAMDLDWELAAVERVLESIRWVEER